MTENKESLSTVSAVNNAECNLRFSVSVSYNPLALVIGVSTFREIVVDEKSNTIIVRMK